MSKSKSGPSIHHMHSNFCRWLDVVGPQPTGPKWHEAKVLQNAHAEVQESCAAAALKPEMRKVEVQENEAGQLGFHVPMSVA